MACSSTGSGDDGGGDSRSRAGGGGAIASDSNVDSDADSGSGSDSSSEIWTGGGIEFDAKAADGEGEGEHHYAEMAPGAGGPFALSMFCDLMGKSMLFSSVSTEILAELYSNASTRVYMPGDIIIAEGSRDTTLFLMVSGSAEVYVTDVMALEVSREVAPNQVVLSEAKSCKTRIGTITDGGCCGELSLLGVSPKRTATIEASTICWCWVLTQQDTLKIIGKYQTVQEQFATVVVHHLERTVLHRITSLPEFASFDRSILTMLGLYCERHAYFEAQRICCEGAIGSNLFIINTGRAVLERGGVPVRVLTEGKTFGLHNALGVHTRYPASLVALQTCHVLVLSRKAYCQAIEQYGMPLAAKDLLKVQRSNAQQFCQELHRTMTRKMFWRRCVRMLVSSRENEQAYYSVQEFSAHLFHVWRDRTAAAMEARQQRKRLREECKQRVAHWCKQRQLASERMHEKEEMQALVRHNVECRGPLLKQLPAEFAQTSQSTVQSRCRGASTPAKARAVDKLEAMLEGWPTPKPSLHYELKFANLLADHAGAAAAGHAQPGVLPSLISRIESRTLTTPAPAARRQTGAMARSTTPGARAPSTTPGAAPRSTTPGGYRSSSRTGGRLLRPSSVTGPRGKYSGNLVPMPTRCSSVCGRPAS
eukprot:NODE_132_length_3559_cov_4.425408.p1 GENE.NODE_132_length_3559_cov_4.425408~~NODE_132_length_3559_cov_4.425408.p1  ORF type:complete len:649 (-),score=181.56 NODE_132_length_3559_cov_4.425408:386-2332(-)